MHNEIVALGEAILGAERLRAALIETHIDASFQRDETGFLM